jgi:hypothetical protein
VSPIGSPTVAVDGSPVTSGLEGTSLAPVHASALTTSESDVRAEAREHIIALRMDRDSGEKTASTQ